MNETRKQNILEIAEDRRNEGYSLTADEMVWLVTEVERLEADNAALQERCEKLESENNSWYEMSMGDDL